MRRIGLTVVLAVSLIASTLAPLAAAAQQTRKVYRIGYLTVPSRETAQDGANAFESGLRDLGWVNGQNLVIEYRFADGDVDRLPALASELVHLRVDVIVAGTTRAVAAAKNATRTIPIVMFLPIDPIGSGLVDSLARPSGNITGLSASAGPQIVGKQLQLLKDAFPRISRVAILVNRATSRFTVTGLKEANFAARALGLQQHVVEVRDPRELDSAFAALTTFRADAIFVPADPLFFQHRTRLAELAAKSRLPSMWGIRDQAEAGGLMAYGVNLLDLSRRAATYADKILKGAKPGDLPVEQPTKFELVIPIVLTGAGDPVTSGLVSSLARPGGNVTGLSVLRPDLVGKCLELLKQAVPGVSHVAVLWHPGGHGEGTEKNILKEAEVAGRVLGVRLQFVEARGPADFDRAFSEMTRVHAGALTVLPSAVLNNEPRRLVDLAAKNRLPAVYPLREAVDAGGIMSYGPNGADSFRRAATYVDKILKGAKPGDLPVEQPTKFEFVINLKTAKALGLTIPQSILLRADQVIE